LSAGRGVDQGQGIEPIGRELDLDRVGGWGLDLVHALASRWGIHQGRSQVWFELRRRGAHDPSSRPENIGEDERPAGKRATGELSRALNLGDPLSAGCHFSLSVSPESRREKGRDSTPAIDRQ
jgi:hypothetical protein